MYAYALNNPLRYSDPTGTSIFSRYQEVSAIMNGIQAASDYLWSLLPSSVQRGDYIGTTHGAFASEFWSARYAQSGSWVDFAAGSFAALWTPDTWTATAGLLSGARGLQSVCNVPRSYWNYFSGSPKANPTWLAGSRTTGPPYGLGFEARSALNLPPQNLATSVQRISVPWWQPVIGPRYPGLQPQWGWPNRGSGFEFVRGIKWPKY